MGVFIQHGPEVFFHVVLTALPDPAQPLSGAAGGFRELMSSSHATRLVHIEGGTQRDDLGRALRPGVVRAGVATGAIAEAPPEGGIVREAAACLRQHTDVARGHEEASLAVADEVLDLAQGGSDD